MLVVLTAALVVASSTGGALLAQKTIPESTTTTTNKQQGTTTPPSTQQPSPSNDASGASPQATNNCGFQQGTLTGYNIYGPYTYDPLYRDSTDVGANNHSLVYGYIVPQPPQNNTTYAGFIVCKYNPKTGNENLTSVYLYTNTDYGYGYSYLDPPPSGNSYEIHDGLLPPLGPKVGTGIYAMYELLQVGTDYLLSNPHYFYVH